MDPFDYPQKLTILINQNIITELHSFPGIIVIATLVIIFFVNVVKQNLGLVRNWIVINVEMTICDQDSTFNTLNYVFP